MHNHYESCKGCRDVRARKGLITYWGETAKEKGIFGIWTRDLSLNVQMLYHWKLWKSGQKCGEWHTIPPKWGERWERWERGERRRKRRERWERQRQQKSATRTTIRRSRSGSTKTSVSSERNISIPTLFLRMYVNKIAIYDWEIADWIGLAAPWRGLLFKVLSICGWRQVSPT